MLVSASAEIAGAWLQKRVVWQAGKQPRVRETTLERPAENEQFRLALIPLRAVKGTHGLVNGGFPRREISACENLLL
jgi:hypothetical protein